MGERATILEQFRRLQSAEKLAIIDELWLEASLEVQAQPLTDASRDFLDARVHDAESHQGDERDWDDVRDELLRKT
ncbi:MAG: hypothetical protein R3F39_06385 [Myxococcota bacterium]